MKSTYKYVVMCIQCEKFLGWTDRLQVDSIMCDNCKIKKLRINLHFGGKIN